MDKVNKHGKMEVITKDSGLTAYKKEKELKCGLMLILLTKATGKTE